MSNPYDNVEQEAQVGEENVKQPATPSEETSSKTEDVNVEKKKQTKPAVEDILAVEETVEEENEYIRQYQYQHKTLEESQATAHRASTKDIPAIREKKVIDPSLETDTTIVTLRGTLNNVFASLERIPDSFFEGSKAEAISNWSNIVSRAHDSFMLAGDQLYEATIRKGSIWVNQVNTAPEGEDPAPRGITMDRKGLNPYDKNDVKTPAVSRVISMLDLGTPCYVPLYQTGIWVRLKVPTAADYIKLDEAISKEKVHYGSLTRGEIFNNQSILIRKHVTNFILEHVTYTNAPSTDPEYLKSIIKATDLDALMIGLMQARWPDGYPFAQTCTVDPTKCTHTVEGLIDLRELVWTDQSRLTEKQRRMMSSPRKAVTEEDIANYQEEFKTFRKSHIAITKEDNQGAIDEDGNILNGLIVVLEEPTLDKEEEYGIQWINELVRNAEEIFREKHSEKDRRERIEEEVLVSYFKTYGQWVKAIEIYEAGRMVQEITEEDELNELFEFLSSDVGYVDLFRKEVHNYIVNNIVTIVGIMNYECPNCGKKHDTPEGPFHIILPIDILFTFFTQVRSSVRRSFRKSSM